MHSNSDYFYDQDIFPRPPQPGEFNFWEYGRGWIPQEQAAIECPECTQKAYDKEVGGAVSFDETAFNRGDIPPLIDPVSFEEYLRDMVSKYMDLRQAGYCPYTWVIESKLGLEHVLGNQGNYPTCAPFNGSKAAYYQLLLNYAKRQGNTVQRYNEWYTYVGSGAKYMNGQRSGGRTLTSVMKYMRNEGLFRESVVGTYSATAGNYNIDVSKDTPDQYQIGACYIGDLSPKKQAEMNILAAKCMFTTCTGSTRGYSAGGVFDGMPVAKHNSTVMHAIGSSDWVVGLESSTRREFLKQDHSWGIMTRAALKYGFPPDSLLLDCNDGSVENYFSGRFSDGFILVVAESDRIQKQDSVLPPEIPFPEGMQKI